MQVAASPISAIRAQIRYSKRHRRHRADANRQASSYADFSLAPGSRGSNLKFQIQVRAVWKLGPWNFSGCWRLEFGVSSSLLHQYLFHDLAKHIRQPKVPALEA